MALDIKLKRSHTHSTIPTTSDLSEGEFAVNTYDRKLYMRDGSSNVVTVGNDYATDFESTTKTFYVTVATSTSAHVHHGSGSGNKYKINGVFSPYLDLIPGITYRFDQSDSSNSSHPFRFYLDENKSTSYTTGVTTSGTAGSSGAYTEIVVSHTTPAVLHYQCSAHGLMGWAAFVNTHNLTAFDTGDLTEGSNLYYTDARVDSRLSSGSITGAIKTTGDMTADEYFVGGTTDHKIGKVNHSYGDGIGLTTDHATVTIGAGNSGFIHYIASGGQQHFFNTSVNTNGHFQVYSDTGSLIWLNNRSTSHEVTLTTTTPTAGRTLSLPDQTGTLLSSGGDGSISGNLTLTGTLNGHTIPGGSGTLALTSDISASGIGNVVEDTTPQLGGDLDTNSNNINFADNDKAQFGASQDLQIYHTGSHSIIREAGAGRLYIQSDDDVRIASVTGTENMAKFTANGAVELYHNNIKKFETTSTGVQTTGTLNVNGAYTLPTADGNSAQVLTTNGSGALSFASVGSLAGAGISNVSDDSSPQLGGNLDVVTHSIVSTSNRDINLTPNGTGKVVVSSTGIEFSDGTVQTAAGASQGFAIAMGIALG